MIIRFFDSQMKLEVTKFEGSLSDVPLAGDSIILKPSKEYEKAYGFSDKSSTVKFRLVDYRDNSVTVYIE